MQQFCLTIVDLLNSLHFLVAVLFIIPLENHLEQKKKKTFFFSSRPCPSGDVPSAGSLHALRHGVAEGVLEAAGERS